MSTSDGKGKAISVKISMTTVNAAAAGLRLRVMLGGEFPPTSSIKDDANRSHHRELNPKCLDISGIRKV